MGYIYLITCKTNGKLYVGQTTKTVEDRFREHKNCAIMIRRASENDPTLNTATVFFQHIKTSTLYNAMAKHGVDNFIVETLEEVPDSELNGAEIAYVEFYDCQLPKGYNGTSGGDSKYRHTEESIQKMKDRKHENIENMRHEYLRGLPLYTTYNVKLNAIIIVGHPLCKYKTFPLANYGSLEQTQEALINFIDALERSGQPYEKEKEGGEILKKYPGIKSSKKGYKLEKFIGGKPYRAGFESQKFTREQNMQRAIDYYETHIRPLIPN